MQFGQKEEGLIIEIPLGILYIHTLRKLPMTSPIKKKKAPIISINPSFPQERLIKKAVEVLENGGIIAYPTDTFYGIGCDLYNKKAIRLIYQIKKRPLSKPFSFICSSIKEVSKYAVLTDFAYRIIKRYLPGPYTFILKGTRLVPKLMLTKRKTVGIRIPDSKICLSIVKLLGRPIISTTLEVSDPLDIKETYGHWLDLIIDGGIIYPEPSTVISLVDDRIEIIREGKGDISEFI